MDEGAEEAEDGGSMNAVSRCSSSKYSVCRRSIKEELIALKVSFRRWSWVRAAANGILRC